MNSRETLDRAWPTAPYQAGAPKGGGGGCSAPHSQTPSLGLGLHRAFGTSSSRGKGIRGTSPSLAPLHPTVAFTMTGVPARPTELRPQCSIPEFFLVSYAQ